MITKVVFGNCPICKDGVEKALITGKCLYHYRRFRNEVLQKEKKRRKLNPHPIPKVKRVVVKQDTYGKELTMWFNYFNVNAKRECENCEAPLTHYNQEDWMGSQHHILEKSIFLSVAGNLNNHMVLGKWCCRGQWHSSQMNAQKMECFEMAKLRVRKLIPLLTEEEKRRIPDMYK